MADLGEDDVILGPITYFKYPTSHIPASEPDNSFLMQKIKPEPIDGYDYKQSDHSEVFVENNYDYRNDCSPNVDFYTTTNSEYFSPHQNSLLQQQQQQQPHFNDFVPQTPYNNYSTIKPEPVDYTEQDLQQRSFMQQPPNVLEPYHQYGQMTQQNGNFWNNNGWSNPYVNHQQQQVPQQHQLHHQQLQQQQQQQQHYSPHEQHSPMQSQVSPYYSPMMNQSSPETLNNVTPKKRGRKKKIKPEPEDGGGGGCGLGLQVGGGGGNENFAMDVLQMLNEGDVKGEVMMVKERRKHDRFNGMPEEEVSKRTLPDILAMNLDIVIIGINPGLFAAYKGHHYAGPGNHFWKCLFLSGLIPEPLTADDDGKLLQNGIGFTNIVERATKGSSDLTRKEIREGGLILLEKLQRYKPKIAVFNGKLIFEVFSGKKEFNFGRQPDFVDGTNTYMWVMPSSSARCAQLPRASDKVPYYAALKKFRDYLNGSVPSLDENDIIFQYCKLKTFPRHIKEEMKEEGGDYLEDDVGCGGGQSLLLAAAKSPKKKAKKETIPAAAVVAVADGEQPVKKKRGRPKKIRPPPPEDAKAVEVRVKEEPKSPLPSTSSAYFQREMDSPQQLHHQQQQQLQQQQQQGSPSPGLQLQKPMSAQSDPGYYSQNSLDSVYTSSFDFRPGHIQSHMRSFLPSSSSSSPQGESPNE